MNEFRGKDEQKYVEENDLLNMNRFELAGLGITRLPKKAREAIDKRNRNWNKKETKF